MGGSESDIHPDLKDECFHFASVFIKHLINIIFSVIFENKIQIKKDGVLFYFNRLVILPTSQ